MTQIQLGLSLSVSSEPPIAILLLSVNLDKAQQTKYFGISFSPMTQGVTLEDAQTRRLLTIPLLHLSVWTAKMDYQTPPAKSAS